MYITKNFEDWEFWCPCKKCNPAPGLHRIKGQMKKEFVEKLQALRDALNEPLNVSEGGGFRCHYYQVFILCGGMEHYYHSEHEEGNAADVRRNNSTRAKMIEVAQEAKEIGFNRIGLYPATYTFPVHLDDKEHYVSESWIRNSRGIYIYYPTLEYAIEEVVMNYA